MFGYQFISRSAHLQKISDRYQRFIDRSLTNFVIVPSIIVGLFHVITDSTHFQELLQIHSRPLPALDKFESSLVRMGFPKYRTYTTASITAGTSSGNNSGAKHEKASMCMCHLEQRGGANGFSIGGYFCPTCESKYCELPTECSVCHLTLVSAPHLARSYHFLFPVEQFEELVNSSTSGEKCFGCQQMCDMQKHKTLYQCLQCHQIFCFECDLFIHGTIFTCPGCIRAGQSK
jgi:transcription initiation factor TFIIH subunit 2